MPDGQPDIGCCYFLIACGFLVSLIVGACYLPLGIIHNYEKVIGTVSRFDFVARWDVETGENCFPIVHFHYGGMIHKTVVNGTAKFNFIGGHSCRYQWVNIPNSPRKVDCDTKNNYEKLGRIGDTREIFYKPPNQSFCIMKSDISYNLTVGATTLALSGLVFVPLSLALLYYVIYGLWGCSKDTMIICGCSPNFKRGNRPGDGAKQILSDESSWGKWQPYTEIEGRPMLHFGTAVQVRSNTANVAGEAAKEELYLGFVVHASSNFYAIRRYSDDSQRDSVPSEYIDSYIPYPKFLPVFHFPFDKVDRGYRALPIDYTGRVAVMSRWPVLCGGLRFGSVVKEIDAFCCAGDIYIKFAYQILFEDTNRIETVHSSRILFHYPQNQTGSDWVTYSPSLHESDSPSLRLGTALFVRCPGVEGFEYRGVVVGHGNREDRRAPEYNSLDENYDVEFDDGCYETSIPAARINQVRNQPPCDNAFEPYAPTDPPLEKGHVVQFQSGKLGGDLRVGSIKAVNENGTYDIEVNVSALEVGVQQSRVWYFNRLHPLGKIYKPYTAYVFMLQQGAQVCCQWPGVGGRLYAATVVSSDMATGYTLQWNSFDLLEENVIQERVAHYCDVPKFEDLYVFDPLFEVVAVGSSHTFSSFRGCWDSYYSNWQTGIWCENFTATISHANPDGSFDFTWMEKYEEWVNDDDDSSHWEPREKELKATVPREHIMGFKKWVKMPASFHPPPTDSSVDQWATVAYLDGSLDGEMRVGTVTAIDPVSNKLTVHDLASAKSTEISTELLLFVSRPREGIEEEYITGCAVYANYHGDGTYYPATITEVSHSGAQGMLTIRYENSSLHPIESSVGRDRVRLKTYLEPVVAPLRCNGIPKPVPAEPDHEQASAGW